MNSDVALRKITITSGTRDFLSFEMRGEPGAEIAHAVADGVFRTVLESDDREQRRRLSAALLALHELMEQ